MNADDVSAQLSKILRSEQFGRAGRLSRFLRLVVEASQNETRESLKEYRIGVEVFDRGKDFDPRIDPIVRVQAAKLRSKLLEYYAGAGADDPLVITIPKGSYSAEIRAQATPTVVATPRPSLERSRIAVLPFVNMSADPENEHFSDGLTEELINRLTSVPSLRVVARTSAFRFKGQNEDIRDVGAKLNVGTVMEGSVRKAGDQLRVTAQLIDVGSGYHLFSRTYQREYKNIFELQDELAQAVVDEIVPRGDGASHLVAKTRPTTLDAYNVYLRAMFALSNRFADLPECVKLFREAISMEPDYAPAWAGLAHAYWMHAWFYLMPTQQAMPLLKEAALRTLELDDQLAQGHSSLGLFESGFAWNWTAGETRFRRAIELQPGLAIIYPFYAVAALLPQLRLQEACLMVERGLSLDPFNPLFHAIAVFVYANAGRHDDARRQYALGLEVNPLFPPTVGAGAIAYERAGRLDEAIPMFQKLCELTQDRPAPLSFLGHALAISGQRAEAERVLQRLLALPTQPDLDIARVYVGLRDAGNALRHLEAATLQRDIHLLTVPPDSRFDWLRSHPAFVQILERMSLASTAAARQA
jgi:TolB-like protein